MHIKAHNDHPWNEAADAAAWAALHHWIASVPIPEVIASLTFDHADSKCVEWLWFVEAAQQGVCGFPSLHNHIMRVDLDAPFLVSPLSDQHLFVLRNERGDTLQTPSSMTLRCCTANVLTLFPSEAGHGSFVTARQESLMKQFQDVHAQVVGVQETRSKASGHFVVGSFHVLSSTATSRGHGGVQIWIQQTWQTSSGNLDIHARHLRILHASSRRLVVFNTQV